MSPIVNSKVELALVKMTEVADHINEVKRAHDDQLRLQDIQTLLLNYEGKSSKFRKVESRTFFRNLKI